MLLNVSYNNPDIKEKIDREVGKTLTLVDRFKLKGSGSPRLIITSVSIDIHNLLILDKNRNTCNIEIRPNGIIVRFRSILETYALVIPFWKLKIYKGKAEEYSIYRDHYFIKVEAKDENVHKFFKKLISYKDDNAPTRIDDL
ncbi:hypothetical protein INR75_00825 [Zunongwangia sp. SCSIO 43204]|uniref:hypothetical protein n=1 Tax=Zunongwangia sp. SCSIO 43204 TaxID=2779359 RepID=UPI001CA87551|nr:hypothetical protein [Zunongwangia sp. SCSIO 43204]UAB84614.1 hypothetical protein INR75_00825 [Zunongwangia sp. SCSIO 43204]